MVLRSILLAGLVCLMVLISAKHADAEIRDPDGVAVIIGNKRYLNDRVPTVDYAHRDAEAFKRYVLDVLGFDPDNIIDLRDATQAQVTATFGNRDTHKGKLWRYLDPAGGSNVVVYFSGHGVPGQSSGRGYLLPSDADPDAAEINGFPIDLLYENLGKLEAVKSVRVFLDACFSGDSHKGMLVRSASPVFVKAQLPEAAAGLTVLTAASGSQLASWDETARHGLFTEHLLDALYGKADADGDGRVLSGEAKAYLDRHMTRAARRSYGREQQVSLFGAADVPLASRSGAFPARPTEVAALPAASAPVVVPAAPDGAAAETALKLPRADKVLIQRGLNSLQLDAGPADGLFGPKTRAAIKAWQGEKGFAESGYLDGAQASALVASGRAVTVASAAPAATPASSRPAAEPQVAVGVFPKRYQPGDKFRDCADCPEMVVVPPGSFRFGDGNTYAKPARDVRIGYSFAVGVYEVTFAEWDACVADGGCGGHRPDDLGFGRDDHPVINVNWDDAKGYISWLSNKTGEQYRLLSESEWEYVARAGTTTAYSWGNSAGSNNANCDGCGSRWDNKQTSPVGSFAANAFGLYDVHGNVSEWTEDCWHESYGGLPTDGGAWTQGGDCDQRVYRGGSYFLNTRDMRSASSLSSPSGYRRASIGFRLARKLLAPGREVAVASAAPTPPASSRSATGPQVAVGVFPMRYQPGDKFRDCADCPEMVVVPAGSFRMGDLSGGGKDDEKPVHSVRIGQPFAVGVYEVTFAQWDACVADGGCGGYHPDDRGEGRDDRPVFNVSWDDAKSYVAWLSRKTGERYRLLSESEWEYVARAGTTTAYSWGELIGSNRANCDGCGSRWDYYQTSPVGSFGANAFGLHDVHGNVSEWTEDCPNFNYSGAPSDGSAWTQGICDWRVSRGGSRSNQPGHLRSAIRLNYSRDYRVNKIGFRLARTLVTP